MSPHSLCQRKTRTAGGVQAYRREVNRGRSSGAEVWSAAFLRSQIQDADKKIRPRQASHPKTLYMGNMWAKTCSFSSREPRPVNGCHCCKTQQVIEARLNDGLFSASFSWHGGFQKCGTREAEARVDRYIIQICICPVAVLYRKKPLENLAGVRGTKFASEDKHDCYDISRPSRYTNPYLASTYRVHSVRGRTTYSCKALDTLDSLPPSFDDTSKPSIQQFGT